MKITSLEPQKSSKGRSASGRKNPHRFNIFLDGKFAFGADEDLVVSQRLVLGKIIEAQELEKLLFEAEVGKLMERMYSLFSIRQRSAKEIREYLKNLSFKRKLKDQEEISELISDLLIERLKQKGLIDDLQFAKSWVESRRRGKQKGVLALKAELFQKGIDREIIDKVIAGDNVGSGEEELARLALSKKMKTFSAYPLPEARKKGIEFLLRRGFEYSVAKLIVEEVFEK